MSYKRISPQPVVEGGTGAQTLTSNGVLLGNTTSAITATTAGTTGQVLTGVTGNAPTFQAPAASSITITGDSGGGLTGNSFTFTGASTGLTFAGAGTTETLGGTLIVGNGGTGVATMTTAYAPVCAGTTATGNLQVASTGLSTSGYVLTSNGNAALPSFQASPGSTAFDSIVVQTFTSSGTYTPTSGMKYCTIEVVGGGGGGGGGTTTGASSLSGGIGGGGGGYARKTVTAATIGASQTVTVGAGGTAGAVGGGQGGTGGTSSVGSIVSATGGVGGMGSGAGSTWASGGAAGGVGSSGDINAYGGSSPFGFGNVTVSFNAAGSGASSIFGGGGIGQVGGGGSSAGLAGELYGGGGGGAYIWT